MTSIREYLVLIPSYSEFNRDNASAQLVSSNLFSYYNNSIVEETAEELKDI